MSQVKMNMQNIKRLIRKTVLGYDIANYFFSKGGEDSILQNIFIKKLEMKEKGFYVDIGAYHPYEESNTYLFYINGWSGINIDARPGSMKAFDKIRPRDINIETGIGEKEETLTYYSVDDYPSNNSFSKKHLLETGMYQYVKKEIPVRVLPLKKILDQHAHKFSSIDILNIDVEGLDLEVIRSNDWSKYRPKIIVAELNCKNIHDVTTNETAKYLCNSGYEIIAKNVIISQVASVFFADKNFEY